MDRQMKKEVLYLCLDTIIRLGLGGMFIFSAWNKILEPGSFQIIVDNYRLLPVCITALFSVTMSMAELLVGIMFIFTKWTREAAFLTVIMIAMFIVALAQAQVRGLDISCGCFNEAEDGGNNVLHALIRDILLIVPTAWLMFKGQRRWVFDIRRIWHTRQAPQSNSE